MDRSVKARSTLTVPFCRPPARPFLGAVKPAATAPLTPAYGRQYEPATP